MKREQEIKKAATVNSNSLSEAISFVRGARWADEHPVDVRHDASEEPKGDNWKILCVDIYNKCWVESRVNAFLLHNKWDEYVAIELVKIWAYIDDLLPKQFGNSEQLKGGKK